MAVEMKILALSRRISVLCGVCSPSEKNDFRASFGQILIILLLSFNLLVMEVPMILYALYQLKMGNIFELLFAVAQVTGSVATRLSYTTIVHQRRHLRDFFNGLQSTFDQCNFSSMNKNNYALFRQCNQFTIHSQLNTRPCSQILIWGQTSCVKIF